MFKCLIKFHMGNAVCGSSDAYACVVQFLGNNRMVDQGATDRLAICKIFFLFYAKIFKSFSVT